MPRMSLLRTHAARTYAFRDETGHGWGALCTVNDETGELGIVSDWGNWAYLWSARPSYLGAATLTHFISDRSSAHYLADKLTSSDRKLRHVFSPEATVKYLCKMAGERYRDGRITKAQCGEIVRELREMNRVDDERDFVDAFYRIDEHDKISSEPWNCFCHEPTTGYEVLLGAILPALIEACRQTVAEREALLDAAYEAAI